jgi:N-acetylglucosaminyldiphosphoundecaprenol N-acetyl-beta-D-mannosaminyltransferase
MAGELINDVPVSERRDLKQAQFKVLGVGVHAVQIPDVVAQMEYWISEQWTPSRRDCHFIAVANVHVLMEAQHDKSFRKILASAHLVVPDGMPLIWVGRLRGHSLRFRVYGPDLLMDFCRQTAKRAYGHFFFGGAPGVPEELAVRLKRQFPEMRIAGTFSPPFRQLSAEEDARAVQMIEDAAPDVLWIGLGCPKQERWMYQHYERLNVPVIVGVGQAFDIHAGRKPQAPVWMRQHGLEWLFRLLREPARLWRRYLIYNTRFIYSVFLELSKLKKF